MLDYPKHNKDSGRKGKREKEKRTKRAKGKDQRAMKGNNGREQKRETRTYILWKSPHSNNIRNNS